MKYRIILRDAIWLTPLSVFVIAWGWTANASFVYLLLMHYGWEDFTFPFNQWWTAAPFVVHPAKLDMDAVQAILDLLVSAIAACLLVLLFTIILGKIMWRRWRLTTPRPSLYGNTGWASSQDFQQHRIRTGKPMSDG